MDFEEKAKIRLERWLVHNEEHMADYGKFADQLESAGMKASATHLREMIAWSEKGNDCLRRALEHL